MILMIKMTGWKQKLSIKLIKMDNSFKDLYTDKYFHDRNNNDFKRQISFNQEKRIY